MTISGGATKVGIGTSAWEAASDLLINDQFPIRLDSSSLPNFAFSSTIRNGYMIIEPEAGDPLITSLKFNTLSTDGYFFDYVAIVPEPTTFVILAIGGAAILRRRVV